MKKSSLKHVHVHVLVHEHVTYRISWKESLLFCKMEFASYPYGAYTTYLQEEPDLKEVSDYKVKFAMTFFAFIEQLKQYVAAEDVDNIQNTLEQMHKKFAQQIIPNNDVFANSPIIELCFTIFQNTEEFIYVRYLCIRILAIAISKSKDAFDLAKDYDIPQFAIYSIESNIVSVIRATFHLLFAFINYDEGVSILSESGIIGFLLEKMNQCFFDLSDRNRRFLEDSFQFVDKFIIKIKKWPPDFLQPMTDMINHCFDEQLRFLFPYILRIICRLFDSYTIFIMSETHFFEQTYELVLKYWNNAETVVTVEQALRCLSHQLYGENTGQTKNLWKKYADKLSEIKPDIFIDMIKRYKSNSSLIMQIAIFITDLLPKASDALSSGFFVLELLDAINNAYMDADCQTKEYMLNLLWMLARFANNDQKIELTTLPLFQSMLEIFEFQSEDTSSTILCAVFPVLTSLHKMIPMDSDLWDLIEESFEDGLKSDNEDVLEQTEKLKILLEKWRNETEEEREMERIDEKIEKERREKNPVPPVQGPDEDTFSELPVNAQSESEDA